MRVTEAAALAVDGRPGPGDKDGRAVAGRGTVEVRVGMCVSSSRNIDVGLDPGSSSVLNRCRSHRSCSRVHAFPLQ